MSDSSISLPQLIAGASGSSAVIVAMFVFYKICMKKKFHSECCKTTIDVKDESEAKVEVQVHTPAPTPTAPASATPQGNTPAQGSPVASSMKQSGALDPTGLVI